jgi:hypothetical protein
MAEADDRCSNDLHARSFLGHGVEDGVALGTNGQAVAGVLHIAAGEDPACRGF